METLVPDKKANGASGDPWLDPQAGGAISPVMRVTPEELAEKAVRSSPEARSDLAELQVESLEAAEFSKLDRAWTAEAKRRSDEVRSGQVKAVPADEALRLVRNSFER